VSLLTNSPFLVPGNPASLTRETAVAFFPSPLNLSLYQSHIQALESTRWKLCFPLSAFKYSLSYTITFFSLPSCLKGIFIS
jgi:hypothetical protein